MTVSTPGRDPRGWTVTMPTWFSLPSRALELVQAGDDAKDGRFRRCRFSDRQVLLRGSRVRGASLRFLTIMPLSKNPSNESKAASTGIRPSFICWRRSSLSTKGLKLVNLINPGRPIVSNNFLVKYGEYVEEVGLKRVPKRNQEKPID